MPKLHHILAVEKDVRQSTNRKITDGYQALQKPQLLSGLARTYTPKDEDGDQLPAESTKVQVHASEVLASSKANFAALWDIIATKDIGNQTAVADVVLKDGTVLAEKLPATYLLWLEKELNDLHTIVSKLPTLDPTEDWEWSDEQNVYVTKPVATSRSKKIPRVLVKAPATDKHPAQVDVWQEDVIVGTWETRKFSGALPASDVATMLDRVHEVREAVKVARSKANETDVESQLVSGKILDYVFG